MYSGYEMAGKNHVQVVVRHFISRHQPALSALHVIPRTRSLTGLPCEVWKQDFLVSVSQPKIHETNSVPYGEGPDVVHLFGSV